MAAANRQEQRYEFDTPPCKSEDYHDGKLNKQLTVWSIVGAIAALPVSDRSPRE